ncbi:hypothetical protein ACFXPS_42380 [Nocardia sp. NPDC059091]
MAGAQGVGVVSGEDPHPVDEILFEQLDRFGHAARHRNSSPS